MGEDPVLPLLLIPPPIYVEDPEPPPQSILLDPFGYLSDRTNATTADGRRSRRKRIMVTFWAAGPPCVSCFTVHCPDLKPSAFADIPKVVCTEDDLVLLRVAFCPQGDHPLAKKDVRYFVYQAGTKNKPPSLKLVRTPPDLACTPYDDLAFGNNKVVLLRCRDQDMFLLAVLRRAFIDWQYSKKQFDLHLYNSKTGTWNTKLMRVDSPQNFKYSSANKVITVGGELGSVGWVDLWQGILICDLLLDNQSLRYIPLPPPSVPNPLRGYPMYIRNIIVLQGDIKYFEMHKQFRPCSDTECTGMVTEGWVAATKKMKTSNVGSGDNWEEDYTIKLYEVPVGPVYAKMLPNLQQGQDTKVTLKRLHAGYPALSLHDDDVVYIMHRPDPCEDRASVVAVDMKNKTLKGVADFGYGRPLGYSFTYIQSGISKHLGIRSTSRFGENVAETSRDGIPGPGKQEVPWEGVQPQPNS